MYRVNNSQQLNYGSFKLENVFESNFVENEQRVIGADWRDVFTGAAFTDRFYVLKDYAPGDFPEVKNGCDRVSRSCAGLLGRIQIRAQFLSGDSGSSFDRKHAQGWNFVPLRNCLFRNAQGLGKTSQPPDSLNRTPQRFALVDHG